MEGEEEGVEVEEGKEEDMSRAKEGLFDRLHLASLSFPVLICLLYCVEL